MFSFASYKSPGISMNKKQRENIQVFVRVRPINAKEKQAKSPTVIECHGHKEVAVVDCANNGKMKTFNYDRIFGPKSSQLEVYENVVEPHIEEVLCGYNCTVFAYGQTGTGKTFTMEGDKPDHVTSWKSDPSCGIIPRALDQLFDELGKKANDFTVRVSFLELYNEELFDLLSSTDDTSKLKIFENSSKKGSVIISGLEEVVVYNKDEVYKILEKGSQKRQTAATLMNAHSSRSHTIFSITIHLRDEEYVKVGKLNLVDLAGSENIGRSGAIDKRAREAGNINQSLLTLGRVIMCLVERAPHVPYRESKLTRLLQDSLGGHTKTSIIATISPAACNVEESLSTLEYAQRAKNIQNKPQINEIRNQKAFLKEYEEQIERLKRDLKAARDRNGMFIAEESYQQMMQKIGQQERQITQQEQELVEKADQLTSLEEEYERQKLIMDHFNVLLEEAREKLGIVSEKLVMTEIERDEKEFIVQSHAQTEEELTKQARELQNVVMEASSHTHLLHDKITRKRNVESHNEAALMNFERTFSECINDMQNLVKAHSRFHKEVIHHQRALLEDHIESEIHFADERKAKLEDIENKIVGVFKKLKSCLQENCDSSVNWATVLMDKLTEIKAKEEDEFVTFFEEVLLPELMEIINNSDIEDLFNELEEASRECVEFLNSNGELQDDVHTGLEEHKVRFENEMHNVHSELQEMNTKQSELETYYCQHLNKSVSCLQSSGDGLKMLRNTLDDLKEMNEECWTRVENNCIDRVKNASETFGKQLDGITETVKKLYTNNENLLEDIEQKLNTKLRDCIEMQKSILEQSEQDRSTMKVKYDEIVAKQENTVKNVNSSLREFVSEIESDEKIEQTKAVYAVARNVLKEVDDNANTFKTDSETSSREFNDKLDVQKITADKETVKINSAMENFQFIVNKFFDKDMKREESTGNTPKKDDLKHILEQFSVDFSVSQNEDHVLQNRQSNENENSENGLIIQGKENKHEASTPGKDSSSTPLGKKSRALAARNK